MGPLESLSLPPSSLSFVSHQNKADIKCLPVELLLFIFSRVSVVSLCRLACCSHYFKQLTREEKLWKEKTHPILKTYFLSLDLQYKNKNPETSYYQTTQEYGRWIHELIHTSDEGFPPDPLVRLHNANRSLRCRPKWMRRQLTTRMQTLVQQKSNKNSFAFTDRHCAHQQFWLDAVRLTPTIRRLRIRIIRDKHLVENLLQKIAFLLIHRKLNIKGLSFHCCLLTNESWRHIANIALHAKQLRHLDFSDQWIEKNVQLFINVLAQSTFLRTFKLPNLSSEQLFRILLVQLAKLPLKRIRLCRLNTEQKKIFLDIYSHTSWQSIKIVQTFFSEEELDQFTQISKENPNRFIFKGCHYTNPCK